MNASVHLLKRGLRSTVHLRSEIPSSHASVPILGSERMGAGTVVEPYGLVLTAHYLVVGAQTVEVGPLEGESLPGQVVGIDYAAGLAAVHVGTARLPGLRIRQTNADVVGEEAFLVASLGDERRVSNGVVTSYTAFEAFWEYMIDHALTCSAASAGLGGGPLVDARGEMLGVISLSLAEVGKFTLAVPAHDAGPMLAQIEKTGHYTSPAPRAWLGITCYPVGTNVLVAGLLPGSPAEASGFEAGDIIAAVNGVEITDRRGLYQLIWKETPGASFVIRIRRGAEVLEVSVQSSSIESFFAS